MALERVRFRIWAYLAATVLALGVAMFIRTDTALADGGDIRLIVGLATIEATITPHADPCGTGYWHCDEVSHPSNTGLDLTNTVGATTSVYFQSFTYSGYAYAVIGNHAQGGSLCPGVDVYLWVPYPDSSVGTWMGSVDFVQINPAVSFGHSFYLAGYGWTFTYLGSAYQSAPGGGCPWDGIHMHQSGTPRNWAPPYLWTNWDVEADDDFSVPGRQIYTTGNTSYNWMHWIQW